MSYLPTFDGSVTPINVLRKTYLPALQTSLVDATMADTIGALLTPGKRRVNFMNAHCFNVMARDRQYVAAVNSSDYLLPDGIGVALAGKMTGQELMANLNGTDLIPELLKEAAERGRSVFLFGGTPGTAQKAAENLGKKIPGLRIAGTRDGYAEAQSDAEVVSHINESGADILLVALGVPMQELWIHRNSPYLNAQLTMGVGAALDFFAGKVKRAPAIVRKAKCEWVWRLAQEPRRLAKRYLQGNFSFLARAAKQTAGTFTAASVSHGASTAVSLFANPR